LDRVGLGGMAAGAYRDQQVVRDAAGGADVDVEEFISLLAGGRDFGDRDLEQVARNEHGGAKDMHNGAKDMHNRVMIRICAGGSDQSRMGMIWRKFGDELSTALLARRTYYTNIFKRSPRQ
jgi:hypothetical protein